MGFKLPEFKKFCFCIPIRYGFIIWGYLSLILSFTLIGWQIKNIYDIIQHTEKHGGSILDESFDFIMLLIGAAFTVLFVVAVHMNNVKLLKLAFKCNLTSVIVYTLYCIYMFLYASAMLKFLYKLSGWSSIEPIIGTLVLVALGAIIDILIKFYVMLLLRNEIKKLETNGCEFRYVVSAAEGKCTMQSEDKIKKIMDEEKGVEDTFNKETVEEDIEGTNKKPLCNSPNNMTETKCTIEWNMKE